MARRHLVLCLSALLGVVCFLYRYLAFRGFTNDHYLHLARAQQMLLGEMPIRDFLDPGLPLMYALSAVPQALFARMLLPEAILVFGCLGLAAALTFRIVARLTGSLGIAAVLTLLQILVFPRSYSYPKLLLYPIAVLAIDGYARAPGTGRVAVLALVTALSFLMRYDHGLLVAVGSAAALVAVHRSEGRVRVLRSLGAYSLAMGALLAPYLVYIQSVEGLVPYFSDAVAFSRGEGQRNPLSRPTFALDPDTAFLASPREATIHVRWLDEVDANNKASLEAQFGLRPDQPPEGQTQRYLIHDVSRLAIQRIVQHESVEDTEGIDRASFEVRPDRFADACVLCITAGPGLYLERNAVAWLYYLSWSLVAVGVVVATIGTGRTPVVAALTAMTALAASTFLRDPLSVRISDIWGLLPLLTASVFVALPSLKSGTWPPWRALTMPVTVLTAGAVLVVGNAREELSLAGLSSGPSAIAQRFGRVTQELTTPTDGWRQLKKTDAAARSLVAYVALCTQPSDRLLVFSFAPELFWQTQRGFAAGYATFVPGAHTSDTAQHAGIARWRAQSVPLAVVFEGQYARLAEEFPLIAGELHRRYSPVYADDRPNDDAATITVLAERNRPVVSTYTPLGTPCYQPT
jgi:hypothetical protein